MSNCRKVTRANHSNLENSTFVTKQDPLTPFQSWPPPSAHDLHLPLVCRKTSLLGLCWFSEYKFNQRSGKTQKQRKTIKQEILKIPKPNKYLMSLKNNKRRNNDSSAIKQSQRLSFSSRAVNNILFFFFSKFDLIYLWKNTLNSSGLYLQFTHNDKAKPV